MKLKSNIPGLTQLFWADSGNEIHTMVETIKASHKVSNNPTQNDPFFILNYDFLILFSCLIPILRANTECYCSYQSSCSDCSDIDALTINMIHAYWASEPECYSHNSLMSTGH